MIDVKLIDELDLSQRKSQLPDKSQALSPAVLCACTMAGSLVCPIVFSTNDRLACTNRAGRSLIGQFSLVINKDGDNLRGEIFCCPRNLFLSCPRTANLGKDTKEQ